MRISKKVITTGIIIFVSSIIIGTSGTVITMIQSFYKIIESKEINKSEIAKNATENLELTIICIPFAFIGICLITGGLIAYFANKSKEVAESNN